MRILLIDDDLDSLELLEDLLSLKGFAFKGFSDPRKAIEAYQSENFDLVITDWEMPELNGLEVLKKVLASNPRARVIILSGVAGSHDVAEAMDSGAFGFYHKPFNDVEGFTDALCNIECR